MKYVQEEFVRFLIEMFLICNTYKFFVVLMWFLYKKEYSCIFSVKHAKNNYIFCQVQDVKTTNRSLCEDKAYRKKKLVSKEESNENKPHIQNSSNVSPIIGFLLNPNFSK